MSGEEAAILKAFLAGQYLPDEELSHFDREDVRQRELFRFHQRLRAFQKGVHFNE